MPRNDKYLTGRYLITSLKQIISKEEMVTLIEICKDSYLEDHEDSVNVREEFFGEG